MFEASKITSKLLEDLKEMKENSEISLMKTKRLMVENNQPTCLYDILEKRGYSTTPHPNKWIDKLSEKYKLVRLFHKTEYYTDRRCLTKGRFTIFFDDYHVDVVENGKCIMTFGKRAQSEGILDFIKQKEREIKLKRLLRNDT